MNKSRKLSALIPVLIIWGILAVLFWSWIFTFLTDTDPAHKITLFADVPVCHEKELAIELEQELPEGIRMVRVHPFTYAMFDGDAIRGADLYILKVADLEEYRDWLAPLPEQFRGQDVIFGADGTPLGIPVFDPATGLAVAESYLAYMVPGEDPGPYCLAFGASSLHLPADSAGTPGSSAGIVSKLLTLH